MTLLKTLLILICFGLINCNSEPATPPEPIPDESGRLPGEPGYQKPEWPREVRQLTYDDMLKWKTPRILFVSRLEGDTMDTVWTMKMDGSDKHQMMNQDFLKSSGVGYIKHYYISKDLRYITILFDDNFVRFDLKERSSEVLKTFDWVYSFQWFNDGERVIYRTPDGIEIFNVVTRETMPGPDIYTGGGFELTPDDKHIITGHAGMSSRDGAGYTMYDLEGKLIYNVDYDVTQTLVDAGIGFSDDGKHLYYWYGEDKALYIEVATGKLIDKRDPYSYIDIAERDIFTGPIYTKDPDKLMLGFYKSDHSTHTYEAKWIFYNLKSKKKSSIDIKEFGIWGLRDNLGQQLMPIK